MHSAYPLKDLEGYAFILFQLVILGHYENVSICVDFEYQNYYFHSAN